MGAAEPLEVEQHGSIRWLFLNRPDRRNALDERAIDELADALTGAEADAGTKAVVIAGRGPSFCAGADLSRLFEMAERDESPVPLMRKISATFSRLTTSRLPIVAALHGHAVAGGLELALAADVVVAAEGTLIGDGHIRNQLLPAGGSSVRLRRKVGDGFARWLLVSGELAPAERVASTGWPNVVVPEDSLHSTAQAVASQLAEHSGPALARLKLLLVETDTGLSEALEAELRCFASHWDSTDMVQALRTFFRGRPPKD